MTSVLLDFPTPDGKSHVYVVRREIVALVEAWSYPPPGVGRPQGALEPTLIGTEICLSSGQAVTTGMPLFDVVQRYLATERKGEDL